MTTDNRAVPHIILTSDASGGWGCGGFWEQKWFQVAWEGTECSSPTNIAVKELIPIVIAVALWGIEWQGRVVNYCRYDNQAVVVAVLQARRQRLCTYFDVCFSLWMYIAVNLSPHI